MLSVLLVIFATLAPGSPAPEAPRGRSAPMVATVVQPPEAVSALAAPSPASSPSAGLARILPLGRLDIALLGLGSVALSVLAVSTQVLFGAGLSARWRSRRARARSFRSTRSRGSEPEPVGASILAAP